MTHCLKTTRDSVDYESQGPKITSAIQRGSGPADRTGSGVVMYHGFMAPALQRQVFDATVARLQRTLQAPV